MRFAGVLLAIVLSPAAPAAEGAATELEESAYLGTWAFQHDPGEPGFEVVLERGGEARSTAHGGGTVTRGTWWVGPGGAKMRWDDGWKNEISRAGTSWTQRSWPPSGSFEDTPIKEVAVYRVDSRDPSPAPVGPLVAARITENGPVGWDLGGPDRDAGLGDWALGNGTICAAVSDPAHEGMLYPSGGVLVDVGHCGRDDDQWTTLEMMWNLSRNTNLEVRDVEVGADADHAWILTRGERDGVRVEMTHELGLVEPNVLHLRLRIERVAQGPRFFAASLLTLHPTGQTRPFTLFRADPEKSSGFAYPESDPTSTLSLLRAIIPADLHVFVGAEDVPDLAYGLELVRAQRVEKASGDIEEVPMMATTGADSTVTGVFAEDFWIGSGNPPGLLELAQTAFMDLALGDRLEVDWRLHVTKRADVASVTDALWRDHPVLYGSLQDPDARLHIEREDGAPVTQVRTDRSGRFSARVPPGDYRITVRSHGRPDVVLEATVGESGDTELPTVRLEPTAQIQLPRGKTMRLTFEGVEGTANPVFGDDLLGFRVGDEPVPTTHQTRNVHLSGTGRDPRSVTLPAGRYRVTATRGPEFAIEQTQIEISAGQTKSIEVAQPLRVLETPGWISADLHVHTGHSFDTAWPIERQVGAFAAEGAEVLVATEHDRVVDPRPVIDELGLASSIVGVPGVEVTSVAETEVAPSTLGHLNAFPVERTNEYRGGAPRAEGRRLRSVLADLRSLGGLSQMNHPRTSGRAPKGAYFMHLAVPGVPFDPEAPLTDEPNRVLLDPDPETGVRDIDFDIIEGLNGADIAAYPLVRADWFSLLRQGERRTLTANSDSHRASSIVALPRTYVRVEDDSVVGFDRAAFLAALREGRAYGTTGPMLDVRLGEAEIGDTFIGNEGELVIRVVAAPWIPVDEVRVYVDGVLVSRISGASGDSVSLPLTFDRDAFVTVEVEGPASARYEAVAPGFVPFAFTNPIFVDADRDGAWTPPGIDGPLPETITRPQDAS